LPLLALAYYVCLDLFKIILSHLRGTNPGWEQLLRSCCKDCQMFLLPLKHKMLFGSFSNHAGEYDHRGLHKHAKFVLVFQFNLLLKLWELSNL